MKLDSPTLFFFVGLAVGVGAVIAGARRALGPTFKKMGVFQWVPGFCLGAAATFGTVLQAGGKLEDALLAALGGGIAAFAAAGAYHAKKDLTEKLALDTGPQSGNPADGSDQGRRA